MLHSNITIQNSKDQICQVQLYEGLDCQVAMATSSGTVIIACVPIDITSEQPNKEKKQVSNDKKIDRYNLVIFKFFDFYFTICTYHLI